MPHDTPPENSKIHTSSVHEDIKVTHTSPKLTPKIITLIIVTLIILLLAGVLIWKNPFATLGKKSISNKVTDSVDSIRNIFRSNNSTSTDASSNQVFGTNPPGDANNSYPTTSGNFGSTSPIVGDIGTATSTVAEGYREVPNPFASQNTQGSAAVAQNNTSSPATSSIAALPNATNIPSGPISIRNPSTSSSTTSPGSGSATGQTAPRAAVAGESVYRNQNLGFQINLPAGWSPQVQDLGSRVLFFRTTGTQTGYLEVYDNVSGVTLNEVTAAVQGSPDVSNVTQTSISGIPAIRYAGRSKGAALVYSNKIYYLHDQLSDPTASNNIKFF